MAQNQMIMEGNDNQEEIKQKIRKLPLKEKLKAVALNHYLKEKKKLDINLEKEMKQLQKIFDNRSQALYVKANEIIEGARPVNEDELLYLDQFLEGDETTQKNQALTQEPITGYWFEALKNSDVISQEIKEKDIVVLKNLTKIVYQQQENSENFILFFYFSDNDYFKNKYLTKKFILKDGQNPVKSDGTIIEWVKGKSTTRQIRLKKQVDKKTGVHSSVQTEVETESFFHFFNSINLEDKDMIEKLNQQTKIDKYAQRMDIDYDIARTIIDEIIPYSLEYYLGVKINDAYDDIENLEDDESDDGSDNDQ